MFSCDNWMDVGREKGWDVADKLEVENISTKDNDNTFDAFW